MTERRKQSLTMLALRYEQIKNLCSTMINDLCQLPDLDLMPEHQKDLNKCINELVKRLELYEHSIDNSRAHAADQIDKPNDLLCIGTIHGAKPNGSAVAKRPAMGWIGARQILKSVLSYFRRTDNAKN